MFVDSSVTFCDFKAIEVSSMDSGTNSSSRSRLVDLSSCSMLFLC